MIVIGTSAVVQPAASLPLIARRNGARLIKINPDETPLSDAADEMLRGPARLLTRRQAAIELPAWWRLLHV